MRYDLSPNENEWVVYLTPEELGDIRSALLWTAKVVLDRTTTEGGLEMKKRFASYYRSLGGKETILLEEELT